MSGAVYVSNGRVLYTGVAPKSVATLDCNEGYRPTFDLNRTCMFGGQWSEGTLSCELITVASPSQGPLGVYIFEVKFINKSTICGCSYSLVNSVSLL